MQVVEDLGRLSPLGPSAVAMGYFDGLHLGHAQVINAAVRQRKNKLIPCVFTFTMRGAERPSGKSAARELLDAAQKRELLRGMGIKLELCPEFSSFSHMSAAEFVDAVLCRGLNAKHLCCGADFRFGYKAEGDTKLLARLCGERGIELEIIDEVLSGTRRISSSWVRDEIWGGNMRIAASLLGRAFGYSFPVVHGKQLGRRLSFPTINQSFPADFIRPRFGVYASVTLANGRWRASVTNIGVRPTLDDGGNVNSETYICGFSGNLYGKNVAVKLLEFLRPEIKFDDVQALKMQINDDAERAQRVAQAYLREAQTRKA